MSVKGVSVCGRLSSRDWSAGLMGICMGGGWTPGGNDPGAGIMPGGGRTRGAAIVKR